MAEKGKFPCVFQFYFKNSNYLYEELRIMILEHNKHVIDVPESPKTVETVKTKNHILGAKKATKKGV